MCRWTIVRSTDARQQRVSSIQYFIDAVVSVDAAARAGAAARVEAAEQVNSISFTGRAPDHSIGNAPQPSAKRAKIGSCIETAQPSSDGLEELLASLRRDLC